MEGGREERIEGGREGRIEGGRDRWREEGGRRRLTLVVLCKELMVPQYPHLWITPEV